MILRQQTHTWPIVIALCLVAAGCAARLPPPSQAPKRPLGGAAPPVERRPVAVVAPKVERAPQPLNPAPRAADPVLGVIERAGLVEIIDGGLGRLLQRVALEPVLSEGKFVGFRVARLHAGWTASQLQAGDVITSLNGQVVERPEQALSAFEGLRQAEHLVVDLLREGKPSTLRFRIE